MSDGLPMLLAAQMRAEFEMAHTNRITALERRIDLLRGTLMGFATNGTACGACQMGNECARERLEADDGLSKQSTPPAHI